MGVMEGDSAVMALFGPQLDALRKKGEQPDDELAAKIDSVRADYDAQLDARYAGARGFVDGVIAPEDTRHVLALALETARHYDGPHIGPFGALPVSL
jgi:acetyl-CoA carboxylase carboxyltransferase component